MEVKKGKITISEEDFKYFEKKGFKIERNEKDYTSYLGYEYLNLDFYFCGWNDNLIFTVEAGDDYCCRWNIKNTRQLKAALKLIEALIYIDFPYSKEYWDAKYVTENPEGYEPRLVSDARNYVRGYEQALKDAGQEFDCTVEKNN